MYKKTLFTLAFFGAAISVSAQKLSGDISKLTGQTEVNLVLDFSGMTVNNQPEESHIDYNVKNKTETEKEQWLKEWNEDLRKNAYSFLTRDVSKATIKKGFSVGDYTNAEYTIHVKVININSGYFAGIMAKPSSVTTEVRFVKTGETTQLASVIYNNVSSRMSTDIPYFVTKIAMSFGTLGDKIGSTIVKQLK